MWDKTKNPKIGVKFKTPTIENPYSILTDESNKEEFRTNQNEILNNNESDNDQSGNEQYIIPDTGATVTCAMLDTKLANEKEIENGIP